MPGRVPATTWLLIALMLLAGLATIIALMRLGVRTFWASGAVTPPREGMRCHRQGQRCDTARPRLGLLPGTRA